MPPGYNTIKCNTQKLKKKISKTREQVFFFFFFWYVSSPFSTLGSRPRLWTTWDQTAETHSESKAANEPWTANWSQHTTPPQTTIPSAKLLLLGQYRQSAVSPVLCLTHSLSLCVSGTVHECVFVCDVKGKREMKGEIVFLVGTKGIQPNGPQ